MSNDPSTDDRRTSLEAAAEDPGRTLPPRQEAAAESLTNQEPATLAPEPSAAEEPDWPALPGYRIVAILGRGGMGVVYQAEQLSLKRLVALKMVLAAEHAGPEQLARFRAEAEAIARLHHPHIVQIHEVGEAGGNPFFSLEYVDGGTLAQKLASTPLPARAAAEIVEVLARAMHAAHQRGIVHRDLKPLNVLLTADGTPKITDFGLAKRLDVETGQTQSGILMGTPSYMAPEQAEAKKGAIGPLTDVYALGAILYEALTGRPPFKAATPLDTVMQVVSDDPVPPTRLEPRVPRDLETICFKCLEKDPARRYSSAEALAADLHRFLVHEPIQARPASAWERARKWVKRHPGLAASVALILTITALGFAGITWQWRQAETARQVAAENERIAETASKVATSNADRERQAREKLEKAEKELKATLYFQSIALAHAEWSRNNVGKAEQLLDDCPAEMRHWEWHYLKRLCHSELLTLRGYGFPFWCVTFSPDGQFLAGGSGSGDVTIWEAATGKEVRTLRGSFTNVFSVAYSPDGRRLASAAWENNQRVLTVWDVANGKKVLTIRGETGDGNDRVFFSPPDGRHLAAVVNNGSSKPGFVRVWNATTGNEVFSLSAPSENFNDVAFSPDGKRLASIRAHQTVEIWDAMTGKIFFTKEFASRELNRIRFSADGARLIIADGDKLITWDDRLHRELAHLSTVPIDGQNSAFSPDGKLFAPGGWEPGVRICDTLTGKEMPTLRGHTQAIRGLAFSPDGRRLASASVDGTVKVWDLLSNQEARSLRDIPKSTAGVVASRDWKRFAFSNGDGSITVWDTGTQKEYSLIGQTDGTMTLAFSPDGQRLASGSDDKTVRIWDIAVQKEVLRLTGHTGGINSVAFSPDGRRLASASFDQTVKVWDAITGQVAFSFQEGTYRFSSVAFSPDGRRLASKSGDRMIKIWDTTTGKILHNLHGFSPSNITNRIPYGASFSPNGQNLVVSSSGADGPEEAKVWDTASGEELFRIHGHTNTIAATAFTPDGERFATAGLDGLVKIWDARTGREILTLHGHRNQALLNVSFSHDGGQLLSMGLDALKVWDATPLPPVVLHEREALAIVEPLFDKLLLKSAVIARLQADTNLQEPLRRTAE